MRIVSIALVMSLIFATVVGAEDAGAKPLTVTYVGNTGYLIACDGRKVAIDALLGGAQSKYYDIPSDSVVALMKEARPPFDSIDVIAVTHWHFDHFTAEIAGAYLKRNSRCELVCPLQVADKLSELPAYEDFAGRIKVVSAPIDSVTTLNLKGMTIKVLTSRHGPYYETDSAGNSVDRHRNVQHLEFLFTIAGRSFLHVGDVSLNDVGQFLPLGLGQDSIDAAFVQRWGCYDLPSFGEKLVRDRILPRRVFFTHLAPKEMVSLAKQADCANYRQVEFPQRSLQTWIIP